MESRRAYCETPVIVRNWEPHIVQTLKSLGFRTLFFNNNSSRPLMIHHIYIFTADDTIPQDAIDCGDDIYKFFQEVIK